MLEKHEPGGVEDRVAVGEEGDADGCGERVQGHPRVNQSSNSCVHAGGKTAPFLHHLLHCHVDYAQRIL
jgi:hypothetical protein